MENKKRDARAVSRTSRRVPILHFHFSVFCAGILLAHAGCAAPGDPVPPHPPVPEAVTDLAARQAGDGIVLTFTMPKRTIEKDALAEPPAIEIFRGFAPPATAPSASAASKSPLYTIPSALVDTYVEDGRVRFVDPIKPDDLANHAGQQLIYVVRTRASKKKDSADSNAVGVRIFPAASAITEVRAQVTQDAIELSWTPPPGASAGVPLPALAGYRVYRGEVQPGAEAAAAVNPAQAKLAAPLELLGVTPSANYRDTKFEFGHTYVYSVRSITQYEADSVESADSRLIVITPRDTFPPAPPQGLIAVVVPARPQTAGHLEFSWAISPERDVAGYNIYRAEAGGASREKLNHEILLAPAFRDMSAVPGRVYSYSVTAVDRAGNESQPSAAATASMPQTGGAAKP